MEDDRYVRQSKAIIIKDVAKRVTEVATEEAYIVYNTHVSFYRELFTICSNRAAEL